MGLIRTMLREVLRARGRGTATLEEALALVDQERFVEAEAALREICIARPDDFDPRLSLGRVLYRQKKHGAAIVVLGQALECKPESTDARYLLGRALIDNEQYGAALDALRRVTSVAPTWAPGWLALADALKGAGHFDAAEDHYLRALELAPGFAAAASDYGVLLELLARGTEALRYYRRAIEIKPDFRIAHSNLVFALTRSDSVAPEEVFQEHLEWARRHAEHLTAAARPHAKRTRAGRLRVGYVSPDFRDHPVAYFVEPVLQHYDRSAFETYCYCDVRVPDERTRRLRECASVWRDTRALDDEALAKLVKDDRIDILVDLTGHTRDHRLLVFARRPAPIQVTWMGYPNTTGLSAVDYRISDRYADPPGMTETLHTERLMRMPEIYMPFAVPLEDAPVQRPPVLERGYVTFGSFNAAAKLTDTMLRVWSRVLRGVPTARLLILDVPEGRARERIVALLAQEGVERTRIELRARLSYREFWDAYNDVDIALDTHPCSGTTTTAHTLWMGVALVTLPGRAHASRVATTMLTNAGLARFAAASEDDYVQIAIDLAKGAALLVELRASMRERLLRSPNMDGTRFTRFLEAAYQRAWKDWCAASA